MQCGRYLLHFRAPDCDVVAICYTVRLQVAMLSLFATLSGSRFRIPGEGLLGKLVFFRFRYVFDTVSMRVQVP